jgi:hypothetical protein
VVVLADEDLVGLQGWWWFVDKRCLRLGLLHEHGDEFSHGNLPFTTLIEIYDEVGGGKKK